jgi:hypothetical protein
MRAVQASKITTYLLSGLPIAPEKENMVDSVAENWANLFEIGFCVL